MIGEPLDIRHRPPALDGQSPKRTISHFRSQAGEADITKYTLRLDTPRKDQAGTNANVQGRILGDLGASDWHLLDNPGNDREQGSKDYYQFEDLDVGEISSVELSVTQADSDDPAWLLEAIYAAKEEPLELTYLPCNEWINPTTGTRVTVSLRSVGWRRRIDPGFLGTENGFLW